MPRRIATIAASTALLVAVASLGFWAGMNAVMPPELPVAKGQIPTYQVAEGVVERSIDLPVAASWSTTRTLFANAEGVVTTVPHAAGAGAVAGDIVASVDLAPIIVAEGSVPMFRTLRRGDRGPDVAQLQQLLRLAGLLEGPADGAFGPLTEAAVRRWQGSTGAQSNGVVGPGSLLFVEGLPARLVVVPNVGDRISAGSEFVHLLTDRPIFVASVTASQRAELRTGMTVSIVGPLGEEWHGELGSFEAQADGRYSALLSGDLCGDECDGIAVDGETALSGSIALVPETRGIVVPISALEEQPSGAMAITLLQGATVPVRIVAAADGFAVVEGIEPGEVIKLPSPP